MAGNSTLTVTSSDWKRVPRSRLLRLRSRASPGSRRPNPEGPLTAGHTVPLPSLRLFRKNGDGRPWQQPRLRADRREPPQTPECGSHDTVGGLAAVAPTPSRQARCRITGVRNQMTDSTCPRAAERNSGVRSAALGRRARRPAVAQCSGAAHLRCIRVNVDETSS